MRILNRKPNPKTSIKSSEIIVRDTSRTNVQTITPADARNNPETPTRNV